MPRHRESPVDIGQTVFVVDDIKFEIHEVKVVSNPSEIIWAQLPKRKQPEAFGPHRWTVTFDDARTKAVALINHRIKQLSSEQPQSEDEAKALTNELDALRAQRRAYSK